MCEKGGEEAVARRIHGQAVIPTYAGFHPTASSIGEWNSRLRWIDGRGFAADAAFDFFARPIAGIRLAVAVECCIDAYIEPCVRKMASTLRTPRPGIAICPRALHNSTLPRAQIPILWKTF